jgi:hypothetical protein
LRIAVMLWDIVEGPSWRSEEGRAGALLPPSGRPRLSSNTERRS